MKDLKPLYIETDYFVILNDPRHLSILETGDEKWMRVIVCQEGQMSLEIDGHPVVVSRNEILFCSNEQKLRGVMITPDLAFMIFCLSRKIKTEILPNSAKIWRQFHNLRFNNKFSLSDEEVSELAFDFRYMSRRLTDTSIPYYKDYIRCLVQSMVYRVSTYIGYAAGGFEANDIMQSPEILSESFFNLLNSTYPTPRTVEWYASRLNRTPNYLSTVIKRVSGKKPMEWITEKAVNEIANLLKRLYQKRKGDLRAAQFFISFILLPVRTPASGRFP